MKKIILISCLIAASAFATDYSLMSNEDMMGMRGSVAEQDRESFRNEMQSRVGAMSEDEKNSFMQGRGQGQQNGSGSGNGMQRGSGSGMGQGRGRH